MHDNEVHDPEARRPCSDPPRRSDDGNCFSGNTFTTSAPAKLETLLPCGVPPTADPAAAPGGFDMARSSTRHRTPTGRPSERRPCRPSNRTCRGRGIRELALQVRHVRRHRRARAAEHERYITSHADDDETVHGGDVERRVGTARPSLVPPTFFASTSASFWNPGLHCTTVPVRGAPFDQADRPSTRARPSAPESLGSRAAHAGGVHDRPPSPADGATPGLGSVDKQIDLGIVDEEVGLIGQHIERLSPFPTRPPFPSSPNRPRPTTSRQPTHRGPRALCRRRSQPARLIRQSELGRLRRMRAVRRSRSRNGAFPTARRTQARVRTNAPSHAIESARRP